MVEQLFLSIIFVSCVIILEIELSVVHTSEISFISLSEKKIQWEISKTEVPVVKTAQFTSVR